MTFYFLRIDGFKLYESIAYDPMRTDRYKAHFEPLFSYAINQKNKLVKTMNVQVNAPKLSNMGERQTNRQTL